MLRLFYFSAVVFLAVSICHAQNIDGKWKGEMQSPNGPMELTFNFNVSGDSLTGSVVSQMGETPISNGKIDGDKFSFDVSFNDFTINHQCTVMGDSISMKVQGFQEPIEMILKKEPASK